MTIKSANYSLQFLGVGSGGNPQLGCSAAVVEIDQQAQLLIDCGSGTINRFQQQYKKLPQAIFITHNHLDHIADLEILFIRVLLARQKNPDLPLVKLFVPVQLIHQLHLRLACYPGAMAEGGESFWHAFQLIPVTDHFLLHGHRLAIYPSRHHEPNSSFCLHLPGMFFYSGDTRPIPEVIHHHVRQGEIIFHDCGLTSNPSHTGLDDLVEYQPQVRAQMVLYHYASAEDGERMEQAGYRVATPDQIYTLN